MKGTLGTKLNEFYVRQCPTREFCIFSQFAHFNDGKTMKFIAKPTRVFFTVVKLCIGGQFSVKIPFLVTLNSRKSIVVFYLLIYSFFQLLPYLSIYII